MRNAADTDQWPDSHWRASAPAPARCPPLSGGARADVRADVAVIGAGYAGLNAALELAERQLGVVSHMVDDLMDASRGNRGKLKLERRRVDAAELVERTVEANRERLAATDCRLALEASGEPLPVDADPVRLEQVVTNLLTNAARYTDADGEARVTLAREGGDAVVTVADNGIGLAPEELPHLFQAFAQAGGHGERGGLGLGLSLARSLVELHGGRIEGYSEGRGRGSRFVVRLPLAEA